MNEKEENCYKDNHCGCGCQQKEDVYIGMNEVVPNFSVSVFDPLKKEIGTYNYTPGKWTVILFYPADFTFVCPTELTDLAEKHETLKSLGVDVYGASTDTAYSHLVWLRTEPVLKDVKFSLIADVKKEITDMFGLLNYESGMALRGTVVINPDGQFISSEIVPNGVGRNADELVRKIEAMKLNYENPNMVCPAKWKKGEKTLDTNQLVVGDISKKN